MYLKVGFVFLAEVVYTMYIWYLLLYCHCNIFIFNCSLFRHGRPCICDIQLTLALNFHFKMVRNNFLSIV